MTTFSRSLLLLHKKNRLVFRLKKKNSLHSEFLVINSRMDKISSEISANSVSDDEEFFAQFSCSDDEDIEDEDNGELFLDRYFTSSQRRLIDSFEFSEYKRSKRSNKKRNARNQIKDKNGRSVRKNFNRPLYIHHRLWKVLYLDQPCRHNFGKLETVPLYSVDELRSIVRLKREFYRQIEMAFQDRVKPVQPPPAIHHFALNSAYIHNEPTFDDAMIAFLLDLQNRDLFVDFHFAGEFRLFKFTFSVRRKIMKICYAWTNEFRRKQFKLPFSIL